MKPIKYLFFMMFALVALASCDTYGDYDQEFSPTYPLGGQYYVKVYDSNNQEMPMHTASGSNVYGTYLYLYNTADNDKDKLWIKLPSDILFDAGILGKISCDVNARTFSGTASNLEADGKTAVGEFTVTSGLMTEQGATTPSNGKADAIEVKYTLNGKTYTVKGFRWTGWPEDEVW